MRRGTRAGMLDGSVFSTGDRLGRRSAVGWGGMGAARWRDRRAHDGGRAGWTGDLTKTTTWTEDGGNCQCPLGDEDSRTSRSSGRATTAMLSRDTMGETAYILLCACKSA